MQLGRTSVAEATRQSAAVNADEIGPRPAGGACLAGTGGFGPLAGQLPMAVFNLRAEAPNVTRPAITAPARVPIST